MKYPDKNGQGTARSMIFLAVVFVGVFGCAWDGAVTWAGSVETLTSAITLQRPSNAVNPLASGGVVVQHTPSAQTFDVIVKGVSVDEPTDGLGVFLSTEPFKTNQFNFVNVLNVNGTNGVWRLNLKASTSAPAQLGVADVTSLSGHWVRIADVATNIYLEAILPPFETNIRSLSYKGKATMQRPDPAPSPKATGKLRVKLNAATGASLLEVRVRNLAAGNSYCLWLADSTDVVTVGQDCPKTPNLVRGQARFTSDTGKGEQLAENALANGQIRIDQYSGRYAIIRDQFGITHLTAVIP